MSEIQARCPHDPAVVTERSGTLELIADYRAVLCRLESALSCNLCWQDERGQRDTNALLCDIEYLRSALTVEVKRLVPAPLLLHTHTYTHTFTHTHTHIHTHIHSHTHTHTHTYTHTHTLTHTHTYIHTHTHTYTHTHTHVARI